MRSEAKPTGPLPFVVAQPLKQSVIEARIKLSVCKQRFIVITDVSGRKLLWSVGVIGLRALGNP